MTPGNSSKNLRTLDALPVVPRFLYALLQVPHSATAKAWAEEAARLIRLEPALVALLWRAYSRAHREPRPADTLESMLEELGRSAYEGVLAEAAWADLLDTGLVAYAPLEAERRHCVATALACERLATSIQPALASQAYLAGLLHDIGKWALTAACPAEYEAVRERHRAEGVPLVAAEQDALGVSHTLAGKALAETWHFPEAIRTAIWRHHHPLGVPEADGVSLLLLVQMANHLAHARERGSAQEQDDALLVERLGLDGGEAAAIRRDFAEALAQAEAFAAGLPEAEPRDLRARVIDTVRASLRFEPRRRESATNEQAIKRLHAQLELQHQLLHADGMPAAVTAIAKGLREGWGLWPALCFVHVRTHQQTYGVVWRTGDDAFRTFTVGEADAPDARPGYEGLAWREAVRQLAGLVTQHDSGEPAPQAPGDGIVGIPLLANGGRIGTIAFDASEQAVSIDANFMMDLFAFASTCAAGLAHSMLVDRLEREVDALAMALERAAPAGAEAMAQRQTRPSEDLGLVVGAVATALRESVSRISTHAQLLTRRAQGQDDAHFVDAIARHSVHAEHMIQDLVAYAHPQTPRRELCLVNYVLQRALESHVDRLQRRHIRVETRLKEGLPRVKLDRALFELAIANLVQNAEEALEGKGGDIQISTDADPASGTLTVCVADNGGGIPPERLSKVFDPFYTSKPLGGSLGLGLTVARNIVVAHGGRIDVSSRPGAGTAFTLVLPTAAEPQGKPAPRPPEKSAAQPTPIAEPQAAKPVSAPLSALSILLADDDDDLRAILEAALKGRGCHVVTATNGEAAIHALEANRFDLGLIDLHMPAGGGAAVFRAAQRMASEVHLIAMSGNASVDELEEAKELGAREYLQKPFRISKILALVQQATRSTGE